MANKKISDLSALAAADVADGDLFEIVDISEASTSDQNKKFTYESLFDSTPDFGNGFTYEGGASFAEQGTWTPSGSNITTANGAYTVVDRIVFCVCLLGASGGASGTTISGLPFAAADILTGTGNQGWFVGNGDVEINATIIEGGSTFLLESAIASGDFLRLSFWYFK